MKTALRLGVALALSALFLWIAFRNVDVEGLRVQLDAIGLGTIIVYVMIMFVMQVCRILRWGILIKPFVEIPLSALVRISLLGLMLIVVLPLRLGELARPYLLKREFDAPLSAGLGTVAVERTVDGLLVTLVFFVTTNILPAQYHVPVELRAAAWLALGIFGGSLLVIVAALIARDRVIASIRKIGLMTFPGLADKAVGMLDAFIDGLRAVPNVRSILMFVALTLLFWGTNAYGLYFVMQGLGWDLPVTAGLLLICVLVLLIMVPAGPGFLGTFQGGILAGLAVFGVGATEAAAYGLIVYPIQIGVVVLCGLPFVFGRSFELRQAIGSEPAPATD